VEVCPKFEDENLPRKFSAKLEFCKMLPAFIDASPFQQNSDFYGVDEHNEKHRKRFSVKRSRFVASTSNEVGFALTSFYLGRKFIT
jgi:hypothetical protein